jgi:hypothetical protein
VKMTDDKTYWLEVFRILDVARTRSGDDLLEKCLNGRPQTPQSVTQLFKMAAKHFELQIRDNIQTACLPFLEANLSFEELHKLKNPEPPKYGSILDEMEAEGRV